MKKVLIVEDDSFLQGLEVEKLKKVGYEVSTASTGEIAMQKIQDETGINVILLDLVLPDFDGFDILKKVKTINTLKNVPVIVFSNLSEEKTIDKSKELGASDFMVKSNFTLDELVTRIKEIVK